MTSVPRRFVDVKKNEPIERQHFLCTSPTGGETVNNCIVRLKKFEHCEHGTK